MDVIFADPCHINPETPKVEKSSAQAALDGVTSAAGDIWSTITNREVMAQLGTGAYNYIKDPRGALKDLTIGIVARVPAASYLFGREAANLVINGPDAAAEDTMQLVVAPLSGLGKITPAAQVLSNPESTQAQRAEANADLEKAGANITSLAVIGGGGALVPQGLRTIASTAASGAKTAAMEIGRASFGVPLRFEPALATTGTLPAREITGIAKGSPTISSAIRAEPNIVFSQNTGGDGGSDSGPSPKSDPVTTFRNEIKRRLNDPEIAFSLTDDERTVLELRELLPNGSIRSLAQVAQMLVPTKYANWVSREELRAINKLMGRTRSDIIVQTWGEIKQLMADPEKMLGLTEAEKKVLELREPRSDGSRMALKQVGELLDPPKSNSTVRVIERTAIDKLRGNSPPPRRS